MRLFIDIELKPFECPRYPGEKQTDYYLLNSCKYCVNYTGLQIKRDLITMEILCKKIKQN